jgi:hypothetical protein
MGEVLYKGWREECKCEETFLLEENEKRIMIEEIRDYGRLWAKDSIMLKKGKEREFMVYEESYNIKEGRFWNKTICKLTGERLKEVERLIGVPIEELFMAAVNKIKNGDMNEKIKAIVGLKEICYLLNPYEQPYTLSRIREYVFTY